MLAEERVQVIADRFRKMRCALGPIIDGHRCDDVEGALVHIALSRIDDPAERARLEAIPTGLTIAEEDVDALLEYGERMVRDNPTIRAVAAAAGPGAGVVDEAAAPRGRRTAAR